MQYTKEQKSAARKLLKQIGYKLSVKTTYSPVSGKPFEHLSFVSPKGQKMPFNCASVFSQPRYETHKAAFKIMEETFRKELSACN